MRDVDRNDGIRQLKELSVPDSPIILVSTVGTVSCPETDFQLESFDPRKLFAILEKLTPAEAAEIERHNECLNKEAL